MIPQEGGEDLFKCVLLMWVLSWILLLILSVRDRATYIEKISIDFFRVFRIEVDSAEKEKSSQEAKTKQVNKLA